MWRVVPTAGQGSRIQPLAFSPEEPLLVGLPDTIWFPADALRALPDGGLSFLLFPVDRPELFDAVVTDEHECVSEIEVKSPHPSSQWVWGAFKMTGAILRELHRLWIARSCCDEYVGTLVNAWIAAGGRARAVRAGTSYVDVGTVKGYREEIKLLSDPDVAYLCASSSSATR